jgi:hypothetical protein
MAGLARTRSHPLLAIHLIATVFAAFIFAAAAPVHSYEFEIQKTGSDTYYTYPAVILDCLAIIPKIGQNNVKNTFSPLRLASLKFFILLGICNIILAFSKSNFSGSAQLCHINIKNSILLKLRI